ncbi:MAG: histidine phosphatase family protein [Fibrobacter sp.]|nr:histidine phosphatase family protein [Fibrobacter sp.]
MSRFLFLAAAFAMLLTACGESSNATKPNQDDSDEISSSSLEETSSSSAKEVVADTNSVVKEDSRYSSSVFNSSSSEEPSETSSSDISEIESSSSEVEEPASSSSEEAEPTLSEACLEMRSTQDKFIPLEDVFDCVLPKEKVVFVIRHGERDKNADGTTGDLNRHGKSQSTYLGKQIAPKSSEEFYYISTKTYRTLNTDVYISKGKGETFLDSATVFGNDSSYHFVKDEDFTEKWFVKNSGSGDCKGVTSWARFTMFAYDTTACPNDFYNVDAKSIEFIDTHFMYEDIPNVTVAATHDKFIAPFLISLTNRKIGLEAHEYVKKNGYDNDWNQGVFKHWPNYLAGVAIIVNENNERAFVPVKGLKTGYLGEHCPNNEKEDDLYTCRMWEKDVK